MDQCGFLEPIRRAPWKTKMGMYMVDGGYHEIMILNDTTNIIHIKQGKAVASFHAFDPKLHDFVDPDTDLRTSVAEYFLKNPNPGAKIGDDLQTSLNCKGAKRGGRKNSQITTN